MLRIIEVDQKDQDILTISNTVVPTETRLFTSTAT